MVLYELLVINFTGVTQIDTFCRQITLLNVYKFGSRLTACQSLHLSSSAIILFCLRLVQVIASEHHPKLLTTIYIHSGSLNGPQSHFSELLNLVTRAIGLALNS